MIKKIEAILIFDCSHPAEYVEEELNEFDHWAFCTKCKKDITEERTQILEAQMPDYSDLYDQARDESIPKGGELNG